MRRLLRIIGEVLWPRGLKCLCCDDYSYGQLLCPTCRKALNALRIPTEEMGANGVCSVFRYDGIAKELVHLLKYDCLSDAAKVFAEEIAKTIADLSIPPDTVLTWVTMPDLRRRKRGIDHGRTLCEAVGLASGLTVTKLLTRQGRIHTQRSLKREARLRNLVGTISCRESVTTPVLLIDDVMTTGATASACAEVLMAAGAPQVFVITATKTIRKTLDNGKG